MCYTCAVRLLYVHMYARCSGGEAEVPHGEEARGEGAAVHAQGPVRHRHGRLAQSSRHAQELDAPLVRHQTRPAAPLQEQQGKGTHGGQLLQSIDIFSVDASCKLA